MKIIKSTSNFVWIEVDKTLIDNQQQNMFIVACYVHDITSNYYSDEIFEELNNDILRFCTQNKNIMLTGDFTGRTGLLNDPFDNNDDHLHSQIQTKETPVNIPVRKHFDSFTNSHGEKIMKLCCIFNLLIVNGRSRGDAIDNYTYLNFNQSHYILYG